MTVRVGRSRIEPVDKDLAFALSELGPEEQSRQFAAAAREEIAAARAQNRAALGYDPEFVTEVDGRAAAPLETVKPNGVIVVTFAINELEELFVWIWRMLTEHAPRKSGRFSESFVFLADGVAVASPFNAPPASEYFFSNVQPYTRKLERGDSPQAPNGVFEAVASLAQKRFGKRVGNMATIRFGYRSLLGGAISKWAETTKMQSHSPSRNRPGAQRQDWLTGQPAIIVATRG